MSTVDTKTFTLSADLQLDPERMQATPYFPPSRRRWPGALPDCIQGGYMKELIPVELIEKKIYLIRGHKVMLDRDLAELYEAETRVVNQAVRRNLDRFPGESLS